MQSRVETMLASYKTTFDELDPSVKAATIRSLLDKELQDKDAELTYDDKGNFTLLKKDGSNFYGDNHQQVNPQSFLEQLLSRHKLLITTPKQGDKTIATPKQPASGGDGKEVTGQATFKSIMKEAQSSLEKQTAA